MAWRRSLVTLAVLLAPAACPAAGKEPGAFFPIMAWNAAPDDPAVLSTMRDCGLTVAGFVAPGGLDACHAAGLKAIVHDRRVSDYDWRKVDPAIARTRVAELVGRVKDHPAVLGYSLRDEPSADLFPGLATVSDLIKKLHPGAWPYINLFPDYATPEQLGAASYAEYLDKFVATCRPAVLSYDHYALFEGGGLRPSYFANLAAVREAAAKHGLPFWNVVLSTAHFNYREATAADLRFQVYTSLAYGARGIGYFMYFANPTGNYRMAPIDQFGRKTETWDRMRNVNLQVARLAPALLNLRSDRVYHFGDVPTGCTGPDARSLVKSIAGPILVGDFTHEDGTRYVMVVNKSFTASTPGSPEFRDRPAKVEKVSPYTGQLIPFAGEEIWLAPGQGALLRLTK